MQFEFARLLGEEAAGEWELASAGVVVPGPRHACATVRAMFDGDEILSEGVAAHRSRQLAAELLDGYALVIAASRDERAAVARLQPAMRDRTFTLREAIALAQEPLTPAQDVEEVAEQLNTRRGLGMLPVARKRRLLARPHPLDIPDTHIAGAVRHASALAAVRKHVHTLHGRITAALPD